MGLIKSLLFNDRAPKLIVKSLDMNAQKMNVTASNIANADTPGYKSSRIDFESVLQDASGSNLLPMRTTNAGHISPDSVNIKSLDAEVKVDVSQGRVDGNNVNLEQEIANMSQTKLAYEAAISAMGKRGAIIKSALTETR